MNRRDEVLQTIVSLAREHNISAREIDAALQPTADSRDSASGRILAWVGGIFILCGLAYFIESYWAEMNAVARIILSLGSGVVLLVLALVFIENEQFKKITLPLFLLAALFQAGGILVAFDELGTGGDPQLALLAMTGVMCVQNLLLLRVHKLTVHVFLAVSFAAISLVSLLDIIGLDWELEGTLTGAAILAVAFSLNRSEHHSIAPFWFLLGGAMTGFGVFGLLEATPVHFLYVGYAAVIIYASSLVRSRMLLFTGTFALIGYLGWFTSEYFANSIGWPLALMIIGAVFIALSVFAVKISKEYISVSLS